MKKEQGATLITVLIIVVLVTLLSTIAVKSGILGLKVATNSQVNALLMRNSDAALFNIENPSQVARQLALDGMFAYFNSSANANDELVFCYRAAQDNFFTLSKASAISINAAGNVTSTTKLGVDGYCKNNQFSMGRSAVLSQVYLSKKVTASAPFSEAPKGTSLGQSNVPVTSHNIGATVISVLPSFSSVTKEQIENCFKKRSSEVVSCFEGLNIPYNMQHADYRVGGQPELVP